MGKSGHALMIDCRSLQSRLVKMDDPDVLVLVSTSYPQRLIAQPLSFHFCRKNRPYWPTLGRKASLFKSIILYGK